MKYYGILVVYNMDISESVSYQFMKQHISVIEFVDLYGSFRETLFQLADSKAQLMKSNEELNKYIIGL